MHEEVNQKVVSLCVRSAKMSATELEKVLKMFLDAQKQKKNQFAKGKQTLKELVGQNAGVTNIEVNEGNIKAFERVARKYGIDFALKKDKSCQPPKYYVFFKARDMDAMTMAFKEFVATNERKRNQPWVSAGIFNWNMVRYSEQYRNIAKQFVCDLDVCIPSQKEEKRVPGRISVKEKLAEKKAIIEQKDKVGKTMPEKDTEKKNQREMWKNLQGMY